MGRYEDAHQRALAAAVRQVLDRLDAHATGAAGPAPAEAGGEAARPAAPADRPGSALETVVSCFCLSPFERDVLVLAAAAETDPTTGPRCAAACGDPARAHPTFALALAALDGPHWSALTPVGPLRRWRLVELADETAPTTSRLRVDERILHFLAGVPYLDARLHGLVRRRAEGEGELPPGHRTAADRVTGSWGAADLEGPPQVELVGADRETRWDVAAAAAGQAGLALYTTSADDLPAEPAERDALARLWQREAILLPAALLVETGDRPTAERQGERRAALEAFLAELAVPLILSSDDPRPGGGAVRDRVTVGPLTPQEQLRLWTRALDGVEGVGERDMRDLVAQFSLPAHVIRAAGAAVRRAPGGDAGRLAWTAGLAEARMSLDELGRRIEPRASWNDLVLGERQRDVLQEAVAHVRQRATVYQEWGFEAVLRRGLGVTALFAGGSGTGKTLAAEVIAGELGVDLFVIDLSQVVSKYIGETEKNLRRVFDAAERGGALLLFDEADALFGKRSDVKDSHDRYANLEVSYLLMRMEAYRGLAVLTTNMKQALDPAFMRRIRFVVDFPFPGVPERAEIWRRVVPEQTPSEGLDADRLAQLTVAGGSIRNIALAAAFLAAEEGTPLRMRHMLAAARTEYLKLERSLTPSEVRGWV
ncbi:ATP-binding protein [Streptomyces albireticuli]|nr:ATP-binding protein [Streptomyces albireticuli]MCD9145048.1 ATP-binding protein [Streptomyces albireticuli]MCD9164474.1 ATP-binding protein [Streptomyces albireticuli]MCD9194185.1 ATP-binding protein [Streptomyces albireticuli]